MVYIQLRAAQLVMLGHGDVSAWVEELGWQPFKLLQWPPVLTAVRYFLQIYLPDRPKTLLSYAMNSV